MFGVSFGEFVLLAIIGMVVVGPRNLPQMMRTLGRSLSKARRMAETLREQSGIDEILRHEGIEKEMGELRKLATGRILDLDLDAFDEPKHAPPPRSREYPTGGADAYDALPEGAAPYAPPEPAGELYAPAVPSPDVTPRVPPPAPLPEITGDEPTPEPTVIAAIRVPLAEPPPSTDPSMTPELPVADDQGRIAREPARPRLENGELRPGETGDEGRH